ncbi:MAG: DNA alkylation repair protein [Candidatus Moraniibacteriota bacterium]
MTASRIIKQLKSIGTPEKAKVLSGFFKTGKGQYGEGDIFLGVVVPEERKIAKEFRDLPFGEIEKLLASPYHEARLTGLLILTYAFEKADDLKRKVIYDFLLDHRVAMNNWDLVDVIAPKIIGEYLLHTHPSVPKPGQLPSERGAGKREKRFDSIRYGREILHRFSKSENLWERRIAIVSTFAFIREGEFEDTLAICETLLDDKHDLIRKATGWMLREVGKRDEKTLRSFLDMHASRMPRTMLRYAIERLPEGDRKTYLDVL